MRWHHEHARSNLLAADRLLDLVRSYTSGLTLETSKKVKLANACYRAEAAIEEAVSILDGAPPPPTDH